MLPKSFFTPLPCIQKVLANIYYCQIHKEKKRKLMLLPYSLVGVTSK